MSTTSIQDNSEDEFESADEGESVLDPTVVSNVQTSNHSIKLSTNESPIKNASLPPVTDGWDNWNVDDEPSIEKAETSTNISVLHQDSASSLSSSPSKTGGSLSQIGSDEDDPTGSSDQNRLHKKKLRRKPLESSFSKDETKVSTRISRPMERRDEDISGGKHLKHNAKDAHYLLDRLAAQSPTRTVCFINLLIIFINISIISFYFSQLGIIHGVI